MSSHAHAVPIQSFLVQPEQVRVLSDTSQDLSRALLGQNTISKVWKGDYCGTEAALLSYQSALTTRRESFSVQSAEANKNKHIKEILWQETLDILTRIVFPNPHPNLVQVYGVSVGQTTTEGLSSQIDPEEDDETSDTSSMMSFIMENTRSLMMKKRQSIVGQNTSSTARRPSAFGRDEAEALSSSPPRKSSTSHASFRKTSTSSMSSPKSVLSKEESISEPVVKAEDTETYIRPVYVVMEFVPTSLYQILHEDKIVLTNVEIMEISIQILQALRFVHTRGLSLHNLTSRKVMLKGNQVKIRGLGQREILLKSGLVTKEEEEEGQLHDDLFAFGLVLLEMCTGKKTHEENVNQLSCASQKDPFFEKIIRLCLQIPPSNATKQQNFLMLEHKATIQDILKEMTCYFTTGTTSINTCNPTTSIHTRVQHEKQVNELTSQVKLQVEQELTSLSNLTVKRLEATERSLIEEQKQLELTLKELEQSLNKINSQEKSIISLQNEINNLQQEKQELYTQIHTIRQKENVSLTKLDALMILFNQKEKEIDLLNGKIKSISKEKQDIWTQFCQKDDQNVLLIQAKNQLKEANAVLTQKIQQETEVVEDLTARYQQAIHGWEESKRQIRLVKKKMDDLKIQKDVSQTRCTTAKIGHVSPNEMDEILQCKNNEIVHLQEQICLQLQQQIEIEQQLTEKNVLLTQTIQENQVLYEHEKNKMITDMEMAQQLQEQEIQNLLTIQQDLQNQLVQKELTFEAHKNEMDFLQTQLKDQLENLRTKKCLTSGCDAPKYLIQASGFCAECQDKAIALTSVVIPLTKKRNKLKGSGPYVNTIHLTTSSSSNKKWLRPLMDKDKKDLEEWYKVFETMEQVNESKNKQPPKEEKQEQEQDPATMLDQLLTDLKKMSQIAKSNERLKEELTEWNAFKVLVEFMFTQQDNKNFQIECCKLMSVLVFNHDRNRIQLVTDGGVEVVLDAMKKFPQENKLHEHAAVVLTNLSHNAESNRKKIFNLGGIDMILDTMEQFPLLTSVQKRCLWSLLTLAGSDWMCEGITARGGVGAILAAMLNCPTDESVQYYGSWALLNLLSTTSPEPTTNVARIKDFARQEGVLEVCEAAIVCFPEHPGIQEKARNVLALVTTRHR